MVINFIVEVYVGRNITKWRIISICVQFKRVKYTAEIEQKLFKMKSTLITLNWNISETQVWHYQVDMRICIQIYSSGSNLVHFTLYQTGQLSMTIIQDASSTRYRDNNPMPGNIQI